MMYYIEQFVRNSIIGAEEYKSEIKDLKSLTTQSKPFVKEEVNDHNDLEESAIQDQNKSKKWWPFSKRGREND